MSDDKWSRPAAPPAPLFTGRKEKDFVKHINDEIQERIIGQTFLYYSIDYDNTAFDDVYGEAPNKAFFPPVRCDGAVEFQGLKTVYESGVAVDRVSTITIKMERKRFSVEKRVNPQEGDFVLWGNQYFEIREVKFNTELFGQQDEKYEIEMVCESARRGIFDGK